MKIDHICFAVKEIMEGVEYWKKAFGYEQATEPVVNTRQKVKVIFLKKENSLTVKLIEPVEGNVSLENFVQRGGGFHHLCFKVNSLDDSIPELKSKGLILLVPPQPGEAFNNNDIAFMLAKYGMNMEIIDTDEKAGWE